MNIKLYIVGGAVRDELLGVPVKDIDLCCVAGSYQEMRDYIIFLGAEIYLERPEFFTIRCNIPKIGATDITLARKDGFYSDGRRPDNVIIAETIEQDLARRDATMNAIAKDYFTGEITDPFNGRKHIKERTIYAVGYADERIKEDSLRLLRYLRFSIIKGMGLHSEITNCLLDYSNIRLLKNVSEERIYEELMKCFRFNTLLTMNVLINFSHLSNFIFANTNIWLKPTLEKR